VRERGNEEEITGQEREGFVLSLPLGVLQDVCRDGEGVVVVLGRSRAYS
jgi:hypothetical protein